MSKRKARTPNGMNKRQRTQQLLDVLRRQTNLNRIVGSVAEKLGIDRKTSRQLTDALNKLDSKFDKKNWKQVEKLIEKIMLNELQWEIVDKLPTFQYPKISVLQKTRTAQATSMVLLDCKYQGENCIVKLMQGDIDKVELFIESIINIFMSAVIDDDYNQYISAPDIITMGMLKGLNIEPSESMSYSTKKKKKKQPTDRLVLVQEKIRGKEFYKLQDGAIIRMAMIQLCKGLAILQEKYNFAHRDFHGGNVMYDEEINKVYIIDFGYSCFSISDTAGGSVQALDGGYGYDQLKSYKSHIPCLNRSHDLCILILSLLTSKVNQSIPWLYDLGIDICNGYRNKPLENFKGFLRMHKSVEQRYPDFTFDQSLFHPWYLYELFHIDIGMTPNVILKRIERVSESNMGRGVPVFKF